MATTIRRGTQELNGVEIMIENKPITFSATKLSTDMSTHAYSGYTKFHYFGEGTLKSPDDEQQAYILYSRTYSRHASDVAFLNTPEKLENDWFVFWDPAGNAYFSDTLASADTTKPFQNYSTGIISSVNGSFQKTTGLRIQRKQNSNEYSGSIPLTTAATMNFALNNVLNKSNNRAYSWQFGVITGTIQTGSTPVNGVGVMETIHKTQ
jgi:hypothetical protein